MQPVPFTDAVRVWVRVALLSFGGPAAQIGVMHRILVEEKKWISERRFLHALNYCMLLPGPEAMQLATYVGWLLHGVRGGLVAGVLFVVPGFLAILALSIAYVLYQDTSLVGALFFGLKAAVLAIVVQALLKLGKRALRTGLLVALAAGAFVAMFLLDVPFPFVILAAGLAGWQIGRRRPELLGSVQADETDAPLRDETPSRKATLRTLAVWLTIWWLPIGLLALAVGASHIFVEQAWFFSQTAVVTFGGAYAVLAYIAQRAVEDFGWLQPGEMLDGLGMAETTPGPLIQVVQFVGFMGAYRAAGGLDPIAAGVVAALVVTWVTFVPCFLWIFLGAPYMERLRGNHALNHALTAITAAVVGVILNLSVWFGLHVLFPSLDERRVGPLHLMVPTAGPDWAAVFIAVVSAVALLRLRWPMWVVLLGAAVAGVVWQLR